MNLIYEKTKTRMVQNIQLFITLIFTNLNKVVHKNYSSYTVICLESYYSTDIRNESLYKES